MVIYWDGVNIYMWHIKINAVVVSTARLACTWYYIWERCIRQVPDPSLPIELPETAVLVVTFSELGGIMFDTETATVSVGCSSYEDLWKRMSHKFLSDAQQKLCSCLVCKYTCLDFGAFWSFSLKSKLQLDCRVRVCCNSIYSDIKSAIPWSLFLHLWTVVTTTANIMITAVGTATPDTITEIKCYQL